ncbi:MAG: hypothetical protein AAB305_01935 [Candidatus Zixiibacteriota bacterium]
MSHDEQRHHQELHGVDYERRDVDVKTTALVGIVIVVVIGVFLIFVQEYFTSVKEDTLLQVAYAPENPKLRDLRASEAQIFSSYKIIDPVKGVYQIPVDRAMELLVNEAYSASQK